MRNFGLCILLTIAVLTIYACSTVNEGTLPVPADDNRETFSVEVVGGLGTFTPELLVEESSGGVTVTVKAAEAEELAAASFNLHYNSKQFSPERVEITDFLGIDEQVLSLTIMDAESHVAVGVAQINNRGGIPVNGSGVLATVYFNTGSASVLRQAAASPTGPDNAVSDLLITGQTIDSISLRWTEVNIGDYDNNSEVNIADITPIAIFFGQDNSTPQGKLVDGDGNGEINLADIAEIAKNYGNKVDGYSVYTDGTGSTGVGEGCTCDRSDFWVNGQTPVVYTYTGPYNPIMPTVFTVRPVNSPAAVAPGTVSNVAEAVIEEGAPEAPTNVIAQVGDLVGNGKILLSWTKSTYTNQYDVAAYEIQRSVSGSGTWEALTEVGGEFSNYMDFGLTDQGYDYQVRARDFTDLTSDWTATVSATPWFQPPPAAPTNVTAVPHSSQSGAVRVEWDAPAGTVIRYLVFGQEQGGTGFEQIHSTPFTSVTYFNHVGLEQQTIYEYYVVTVGDGFVESDPSDVAFSACSEEGDISITSLTTDKTTHYKDGGDGVASNITVVSDPAPDSVDWTCSVGDVTGSGTSVTYTPPAGSAAGVCTITCTVNKGSGQDTREIKMYLTTQTIKTQYGINGEYVDFNNLPSNEVGTAPFRPMSYYLENQENAVIFNDWGLW